MNRLWKNRIEKRIFFLLMIYAATVWMFDGDESKIRYLYFAYGLFCLGIIIYRPRFRISHEIYPLIAYMIFGFMSILWAESRSTAIERSRGVMLIMIGFILLYEYIKQTRKPEIIIYAVIVGTTALSIYFFSLYGISGIIVAILQGTSRIGWQINNVNMVANSMSVGIVAIIGVALLYRKKTVLILLVPITVVLLATGSRTATLSTFCGVIITIICYIRSQKNASSRFVNFLGALFFVIVIWLVLRSIPSFQEITLRVENSINILTGRDMLIKESSTQSRLDYIEAGWALFLKSPIWGNGIGCAGYAIYSGDRLTYLHNNYIELLASGGIIGFLLFYIPYITAVKRHYNRIFRYRDTEYTQMISFSLLVTKLVAHIGTVVYYSKIEYLLLVLWIYMASAERVNDAYGEDYA